MRSYESCVLKGIKSLKDISKGYKNFEIIDKGHSGDGKRYPVSPRPTPRPRNPVKCLE